MEAYLSHINHLVWAHGVPISVPKPYANYLNSPQHTQLYRLGNTILISQMRMQKLQDVESISQILTAAHYLAVVQSLSRV